MQSTGSEVVGHHRRADTNEWAPAIYRVDDRLFSIRPGDPSALESVPEISWPLTEIARVDELDRPAPAVIAVELHFTGGGSIEASLPTAFVLDLCERSPSVDALTAPDPVAELPPPPAGVRGLEAPPWSVQPPGADAPPPPPGVQGMDVPPGEPAG